MKRSAKVPASIPTVHETKAVGIWIRVSTEDQARGKSPEHHEWTEPSSVPQGPSQNVWPLE
jgi:hypothetical protein